VRGARAYGRSTLRKSGDGIVLAGDAAGFLDPVFSSGVCVALASAEHLAYALAVALRNPAREDELLAVYDAFLRRALGTMTPFLEAWYDGALKRIFYHPSPEPTVRGQITSILAGELWATENPLVKDGARWLRTIDSWIKPGA
jgi:flavin-dependent dehydrogenase